MIYLYIRLTLKTLTNPTSFTYFSYTDNKYLIILLKNTHNQLSTKF